MAGSIYKKLLDVQTELKAPKSQFNKFGGYSYRSCEDILEGLKPLLKQIKATVILTDEIKLVGDRYYVEATCKFIDIETGEALENKSLAREDENKKGMDLAQVTGSCSSYARKYALNGMFCIDDVKDADAIHGKEDSNKSHSQIDTTSTRKLSDKQLARLFALGYKAGFNNDKVKEQIFKKFNVEPKNLNKQQYDTVCLGYENLIGNGEN
jgi:hypothetical protein